MMTAIAHASGAMPVSATAESQCYRSYFYVGGGYVDAVSADGERVFTGQMYVEQLIPIDGVKHPWPIVFIQGAGQTGTVSLSPCAICSVYCLSRESTPFESLSYLEKREWSHSIIQCTA